jgi:hypothetical protein
MVDPFDDLLDETESDARERDGPTDRRLAKFDVRRLLYPDAESRAKYYESGKQWGWLNSNDILELEDMNPIPSSAGEVYWMPTNMQDADHPITAPHLSGGEYPGVEKPQRPELPTGGAPQNRSHRSANDHSRGNARPSRRRPFRRRQPLAVQPESAAWSRFQNLFRLLSG